jgi:O-antigen/teichoic acid export membrane protein
MRQIAAQGLNVLGAVFMARLLTPAQFGVYGIIVFVRSFLTAFGDAGLAASLIRQRREPEDDDYRVVFTFQQGLMTLVAVPFWFACPLIAHLYKLPVHDAWVFRLVDLSLICSSFQVIPSVRLERDLAFEKIAVVELTMAAVFNGVSVLLAYRGWQEMSFAWGLLLRSLAGAALANLVRPSRIGWSADWSRVREHFRFGLPYQGIAFTSLLKDSIGPTLIALFLSTAAMGYVNWANMVAVYPLLILTVLQRVYLPAFARLQENPAFLPRFVEKILRATNGLVAPLAIVTLVFIRPITSIAFGEKWLAALPLFYVFWMSNLFTATSTPLQSLLNALGCSGTTFLFAAIWTAGTWVIGAPLIILMGALGYPIATAAVNLTNVFLFRIAQSHVRFKIFPVVAPVWGLALGLGAAAAVAKPLLPLDTAWGLAGCIVGYVSMYTAICLVVYRSDVRQVWALFWRRQWNPASLQ